MPRTAEGVGWRARDTAARAAHGVSPKAVTLRDRVLERLRGAERPMTADEIADALGAPYGSVRPRCSELAERGLIVDSGARREGRFGKTMIAWRLAEARG